MDAAHAGDHLGNVGQPFILPSSHIGSPWSMFQFCQDSYAIAAAFGPELFITATANPQWVDIHSGVGLQVDMSKHNGDSVQGIPQQLVGCILFHQLQVNATF